MVDALALDLQGLGGLETEVIPGVRVRAGARASIGCRVRPKTQVMPRIRGRPETKAIL